MNTDILTRTQISLLTRTTLASIGIKVNERLPRSIHPFGRKAAKYGAGTETPKTREGKNHPGGRSLRRRLAKLALRRKMHNEGDASHTMPASMAS